MFIESPPDTENVKELFAWLKRFHTILLREDIHASATWDPGSIATLHEENTDVTVTGAEFGDYVLFSFSADIGNLVPHAFVSAADTVEIGLFNHSGAPINLDEMTVYIRVLKRTT